MIIFSLSDNEASHNVMNDTSHAMWGRMPLSYRLTFMRC